MSNQVREAGMAALAFSRRTLMSMLEAIPNEKLLYRPGDTGNHALWIAGHMAWTDDYFLQQFNGEASALPQGWSEKFGQGSTPGTDPSSYPAYGEVLGHLGTRREAFMNWIKSLSESQVAAPLSDDWKSMAPTMGAFLSAAACHESMHAGQLTVIRRCLGLEPVFG